MTRIHPKMNREYSARLFGAVDKRYIIIGIFAGDFTFNSKN